MLKPKKTNKWAEGVARGTDEDTGLCQVSSNSTDAGHGEYCSGGAKYDARTLSTRITSRITGADVLPRGLRMHAFIDRQGKGESNFSGQRMHFTVEVSGIYKSAQDGHPME